MTSNEQSNPSTPGQGEQSIDSVFDFLYQDAQRVGSFLSQFDTSGVLTGITQEASVRKETRDAGSMEGSLGNALIARGAVTGSIANATGHERFSQRTYDPIWANARALLDFLDERGFIGRDLKSARIGQFLLVRGALWVLDLSILKDVINHKDIGNFFVQQTQGTGKSGKSGQVNETKLGIAMVSVIPHLTQARLISDQGSIWSTLQSGGLTLSSADLLMKHGATIAGEWNMLGILDAVPEAPEATVVAAMAAAMAPDAGAYVNGLLTLMPLLRPLVGRPSDSYGMTPLLIFREVTGG